MMSPRGDLKLSRPSGSARAPGAHGIVLSNANIRPFRRLLISTDSPNRSIKSPRSRVDRHSAFDRTRSPDRRNLAFPPTRARRLRLPAPGRFDALAPAAALAAEAPDSRESRSAISQNRRRRFDASGVLEKLFDETVKKAMTAGLVIRSMSADGTLVRANASDKSFVPIELAMDPEEYKKRLREQDQNETNGPQDPGNRAVNFRGEKRSNKTHRSATDPDCRFASKGSTGTGAVPGYTVNALMENRSRILLRIGVEIFHGPTAETESCVKLLDRAKRRLRYKPKTLGPTGAISERDSSRRSSIGRSSLTSPRPRREARLPMRGYGCVSVASVTRSLSDVTRKSRSCLARRRTGMGCGACAGGVSSGCETRLC
jgi:hypothetical protein